MLHARLLGQRQAPQRRGKTDRARQASPDLVTMDLTMPEMDGLACIPALLAAHPRTRILVISALDDKSTAIRALRLGAHGFLPKPFTDEALQLALHGLVQHKA